MSTKTEHPDYAAAPRERRWSGAPLVDLWAVLNADLKLNPSKRAWRVLPGGAFVMLLLHGNRRVCRILRTQKPARANGAAMFEREVDVFVTHFGVQRWERAADTDGPGIGIRLVEVSTTL